jgi:uncharacterized membrane protein
MGELFLILIIFVLYALAKRSDPEYVAKQRKQQRETAKRNNPST